MTQHTYWKKQTRNNPLFPDVLWNKPEQRSRAGTIGIIGGNKLGFAGVAEAYRTSINTGVGRAKVLLPKVLQKSIPITIDDAIFSDNNSSGSLSRDALYDMKALGRNVDDIILIGDAGRSSETSIVYDDFINSYDGWLTITRDAYDILKESSEFLVERDKTLLVLSFAQLQKLLRSIYYPKILTFSMQLLQLVETLHKFTTTHPVTIVTLHKDNLVISHDGNVVSMEWDKPMDMWLGKTATRASSYLIWNSGKPLEAITTSILE